MFSKSTEIPIEGSRAAETTGTPLGRDMSRLGARRPSGIGVAKERRTLSAGNEGVHCSSNEDLLGYAAVALAVCSIQLTVLKTKGVNNGRF